MNFSCRWPLTLEGGPHRGPYHTVERELRFASQQNRSADVREVPIAAFRTKNNEFFHPGFRKAVSFGDD
jgi:hypothetical protein